MKADLDPLFYLLATEGPPGCPRAGRRWRSCSTKPEKITRTSPGLDAPSANAPKHSFAKNSDRNFHVDVPQAATILSAYQEARALLIGKSVALTNGMAGTVEEVWLDHWKMDEQRRILAGWSNLTPPTNWQLGAIY
jgi:hypothetical protein